MAAQAKPFTGTDEDFAALLQTLGRQDAEMKDPVYGMGYGSSDPRDYYNVWTDGRGEVSPFAKWHLDQGLPFGKLFGPGRPSALESVQYAIKKSYYEQGYPIEMLNLPRYPTKGMPAWYTKKLLDIYDRDHQPEADLPEDMRRRARLSLRNATLGAHAPALTIYMDVNHPDAAELFKKRVKVSQEIVNELVNEKLIPEVSKNFPGKDKKK